MTSKTNTRTFRNRPGFSYIELVVGLALFTLTLVSVMESLDTTWAIQEEELGEEAVRHTMNQILVGLRTGNRLFEYGLRYREKQELRRRFSARNPEIEYYFDGRTDSLRLRPESGFRKIGVFPVDTGGTTVSGRDLPEKAGPPTRELKIRQSAAGNTGDFYPRIELSRRVLHGSPFLFRYRLEYRPARGEPARWPVETTISWFLTPFFH